MSDDLDADESGEGHAENLRAVVVKLIDLVEHQGRTLAAIRKHLDRIDERFDDDEQAFEQLLQTVAECCAPVPFPDDVATGGIVLGDPQPKGT